MDAHIAERAKFIRVMKIISLSTLLPPTRSIDSTCAASMESLGRGKSKDCTRFSILPRLSTCRPSFLFSSCAHTHTHTYVRGHRTYTHMRARRTLPLFFSFLQRSFRKLALPRFLLRAEGSIYVRASTFIHAQQLFAKYPPPPPCLFLSRARSLSFGFSSRSLRIFAAGIKAKC